jgi:hypothetical protein
VRHTGNEQKLFLNVRKQNSIFGERQVFVGVHALLRFRSEKHAAATDALVYLILGLAGGGEEPKVRYFSIRLREAEKRAPCRFRRPLLPSKHS